MAGRLSVSVPDDPIADTEALADPTVLRIVDALRKSARRRCASATCCRYFVVPDTLQELTAWLS